MDNRISMLRAWLETVLEEPLQSLLPASEDASFRRYFRARTATTSYIAMDAPPEHEPIDQFMAVDRALIRQGVHAPAIFQQDIELGFLLLEDLGDRTYLAELPANADKLYSDAITALLAIQQGTFASSADSGPHQINVPLYDAAHLMREMDLFEDWYLNRHLGIKLDTHQKKILNDTKALLIAVCKEQPAVWVHRDYHSRNLMITEDNSPAVIDFQDLVLGPISYDLASLFKDCYITWPRTAQHRWLHQYLQLAESQLPNLVMSLPQLIRWVDLTGLQRHLKVLGIFCRLNYRDGKPAYLEHLARVISYVDEVLEIYPQLADFRSLMQRLDVGNQ